jgi:GT2 family glycosyltransferase
MDVDWVAGAFLLMRGDAFRRLGGLSEQFFFYGEDIELCARVWRAGLRVRYQSDATITHFGGGSSDPTRMAAQARSTLAWKGRYLVLQMVYGRPAAWLVRVVDTLTTGARLVLMPLLGRRSSPQYQVIRSQWSVLRRPLRA